MSNLGFQGLYGELNAIGPLVAERAFLPDAKDMALVKEKGLTTLESGSKLRDMDVIAFSISFEEDYFNVVKILELAGLSPLVKDRSEGAPLILAGGCAVTLNPEPMADIIDAAFIGEAEGAMENLLSTYIKARERGRDAASKELAELPGIYIPSLYNVKYDGELIESITPSKDAPMPVRRVAVALDKERIPETSVLTPETEFKDTWLLEAGRGCPRGCRFCTAGFIYLPPREQSLEAIKGSIDRGLAEGEAGEEGFAKKLGLVGAAISEHPNIKEILRLAKSKNIVITLSSLRLDMLDGELLELLRDSGYRTITIAPEAGSERLRRVLNKPFTDKDILSSVALIRDAGFKRIKLYFMVGLPTETDDDIQAMAKIICEVRDELKAGQVSVSVNAFVPKPFTPFQWHPFAGVALIDERFSILKKAMRGEGAIELRVYAPASALIQAYLSRADRRASSFIINAARTTPRRAVRAMKLDLEAEAIRERRVDEVLPWDVVDTGIKKSYLAKEYERAKKGELTEPCNVGSCVRCGVC
jgi:radical SAM superfamily enzyme YgiQ (UPF0313 family)